MNPRVIVDTNILFAALVNRHSRLRETIIMEQNIQFCCPRFVFTELFKYKERIMAATDLTADEMIEALNALFAHIECRDTSILCIVIRRKCLTLTL